jgi:hypothetical protein
MANPRSKCDSTQPSKAVKNASTYSLNDCLATLRTQQCPVGATALLLYPSLGCDTDRAVVHLISGAHHQ